MWNFRAHLTYLHYYSEKAEKFQVKTRFFAATNEKSLWRSCGQPLWRNRGQADNRSSREKGRTRIFQGDGRNEMSGTKRGFFKRTGEKRRAGQTEKGKATVIPKAIHKVEKKFHPSTFASGKNFSCGNP